ncbi:STAS domain-containing protein [Aeoliella mucimassa]|uniref:STAS domain protein n=1 Tax=Aeoliella mucimassa TaxID=2527972 RepID=A0A518AUY6_9BACT|nr:STAS domain-containing protein [Aeoliella mucimassa]QDU58534.1 STAS domain protein [Aeoliella mucimassa]
MAEVLQLTDDWRGEHYHRDGWLVIQLIPSGDGFADPLGLAEALWGTVADWQPPMMVLDLAQVTFMSSSLMGKLVQLHKRIAMAAGEFHVACLAPHPTEALHACRLHTVIPLFDSVEAAARLGVRS